MILTNSNYFRETALYYDKYKRYPDGEWDSYEYHEYWEEEYTRCLKGYKVGDMSVTGYHYWYLNHWPILLTRKDSPDVRHIEDIITGNILGLEAERMTGSVGAAIPKRGA